MLHIARNYSHSQRYEATWWRCQAYILSLKPEERGKDGTEGALWKHVLLCRQPTHRGRVMLDMIRLDK